jgi:hypothetical protein
MVKLIDILERYKTNMRCSLMLLINLLILFYKILNLRDIRAIKHDFFQNNSAI